MTEDVDQFAHRLATLEGDQKLEQAREYAQWRAYRSAHSPDVCRRWATLSLSANARMDRDNVWHQARQRHQNFALRTWVIEHVGPGDEPDWDPEALAEDTLAALSLDTSQASSLSATWRALPIEQIGELRRHKNLTGHVGRLVRHLEAGVVKDRLTAWLEVRERLP